MKWSKNFKSCVLCGSVKYKHMAKGKCSSCYSKEYKKNPIVHDRMRQQQHDWYIMNRDLSEMKIIREKQNFDGKRQKVLERDKFCCVQCGDTANLTVHHKDGTSARKGMKANNKLSNLITLCRRCHINEHRSDLQDNKFYRGKNNQWSKKYSSCIECGTIERKHAYHGLCINCAARHRYAKKSKI